MFINAVLLPDTLGAANFEIYLNSDSILGLRKIADNQYTIAIKPEYSATLSKEYFGQNARIKRITSTIADEQILQLRKS
jgi:hypothetical protein